MKRYTIRTNIDVIAHRVANRAADRGAQVTLRTQNALWVVTVAYTDAPIALSMFWRRTWLTPSEQIERAERMKIPY